MAAMRMCAFAPRSSAMDASSSLRKLELTACMAVWCFAVFYSIYRVSINAYGSFHQLSDDDFVPGWWLLGGHKDVSDYEWNFFASFVPKFTPWIIFHVLASNYIKRTRPLLLPHFYVAFSLVSVIDQVGFPAAGYVVFQVVVMFISHLARRKWLCWIVSFALLCVLNLESMAKFKAYLVLSDTKEEFALAVVIAWVNCRVLSFCMIKCDEFKRAQTIRDDGIVVLLAYCLYFPFLYSGPIVMYDDFTRDLFRPADRWSTSRVIFVTGKLIRYTFWFVFAELALHFFHGSALHYQSHLVAHLPLWSLCGLGFGMSQFFMVKYTVLYGLSATVACAEGFDAPPPPKCIARIHLYSDMWKYFDFGLYTFLKRFIYIPMVGQSDRDSAGGKLLARFACFAFVYVWHGATSNVLVWCALNLLGITAESCAQQISRSSLYRKFALAFGCADGRHARALFAAPLLAMSAMSNFYFICGGDIGDIFIRRILTNGSLGSTVAILGVLFCMCHVSEEIRCRERRIESLRRGA